MAYEALAASSPLRADVTAPASIFCLSASYSGGLYFGTPREWNKETGSAFNTMRYTKDEVVRVARVAFELAAKRRGKLTSVDKANVLETSQLWRATVTDLAAEYPGVNG